MGSGGQVQRTNGARISHKDAVSNVDVAVLNVVSMEVGRDCRRCLGGREEEEIGNAAATRAV